LSPFFTSRTAEYSGVTAVTHPVVMEYVPDVFLHLFHTAIQKHIGLIPENPQRPFIVVEGMVNAAEGTVSVGGGSVVVAEA
jgi:hypothetical protein